MIYLDCSTISDGLVRVDALVQLLAREEVGEELLNLGDTSRSTHEDDVVDGRLVHLRIPAIQKKYQRITRPICHSK